MTPEERRIYNEKYYAEHKKDITEKLSFGKAFFPNALLD